VLRVRYGDENETWLYFTPSLGQMVKFDKRDRANRWVYYGLHVMDWPGLFNRRPLWDIVTIALLAGLGAMSITTLLPAFRRLKRHVVHGWKWAPFSTASGVSGLVAGPSRVLQPLDFE